MADYMSIRGITRNGTGLVRTQDGIYTDARMTYVGAWTLNSSDAYIFSNGATWTFTMDASGAGCTSVAVVYDDGPTTGSFTVSVNGASSGAGFATVAGGGTTGWKRVVLSGLTGLVNGSTVKVTTTSASIVILAAFEAYGAAGFSTHNLAQSGSTASGSGAASWSDTSNGNYNLSVWPTTAIYAQAPCVVDIALGTNDVNGGASAATLTTALTTIRNAFPNADAILHFQPQPGEVALATWQSYAPAMYQLADTLDVPLLDLHDRMGGYTIETANNLTGDAVAHLKSEAYADWGLAASSLRAA
jgi:lysophospholipase L1-like esterase